MKYRKLPVVIDAEQYVAGNESQLMELLDGCRGWYMSNAGIAIPTLEGLHYATLGDWIIKGVKGEFYPCKPDIFALTYEPVLGTESVQPYAEVPEQYIARKHKPKEESSPAFMPLDDISELNRRVESAHTPDTSPIDFGGGAGFGGGGGGSSWGGDSSPAADFGDVSGGSSSTSD